MSQGSPPRMKIAEYFQQSILACDKNAALGHSGPEGEGMVPGSDGGFGQSFSVGFRPHTRDFNCGRLSCGYASGRHLRLSIVARVAEESVKPYGNNPRD